MTAETDLRRQLTAAGMFLDLQPRTMGRAIEVATMCDSLEVPLTADEAEQLLVWLDDWTGPDRILGHGELTPPAGWELTRRSWCPRCDWGGDPLGHPRTRSGPLVPWVKPGLPQLEIGPGCPRGRHTGIQATASRLLGKGRQSAMMPPLSGWLNACATRRLYRWGLRRQAAASNAVSNGLRQLLTAGALPPGLQQLAQQAAELETWRSHVSVLYGAEVARAIETEARVQAIASGETFQWWLDELLVRHYYRQATASSARS